MEWQDIQEIVAYNHGLTIVFSFILRDEVVIHYVEVGRCLDGGMTLFIGERLAPITVYVPKVGLT